MLILALDPGGTTGYAVGRIVPISNNPEQGWFEFLYAREAKLSPVELYGLLDSICPLYLIAETFEFRQNTRDNVELISRDLLGVCSLWTAVRDCNYRLQSPSEGKGFYSDTKLRQLNCYARGRVHARDATRHLLYFLAYKGGAKLHTKASRLAILGIE